MDELLLVPFPREVKIRQERLARPSHLHLEVRAEGWEVARDVHRLADDLLELAGIRVVPGVGRVPRLLLDIQPGRPAPEGYRLVVSADGFQLIGADPVGLFYAGQTLLQLLALHPGDLPQMEVVDWPRYRVREVMLDMGRAPFSLSSLKRFIRVIARLKLNSLHLHLNDDQLTGLRFRNLPLGSENPWAITLEELGQLVTYARRWHVRVVPEIECWGHAGSFIYHYPHLKGGPGMWGGFSFGLGEELYGLLERVFDEILPVLEPVCEVHVGLDEAQWFTLPSVPPDRRGEYSPERHVYRLYEILQRLGARHNRQVRMRLWADHGGRPIPDEIKNEVVVEPWRYHECRRDDILKKVAHYGGEGKPPFMMGAGMSSQHHQGAYGATRIWARAAENCPNVEGIDICLWESNDLVGRLVGVFAGADYAWTPQTPAPLQDDPFHERLHGEVMLRMKRWQSVFREASEEALRLDAAPEVFRGFYVAGPLAGRPVAPTCLMEGAVPEEV